MDIYNSIFKFIRDPFINGRGPINQFNTATFCAWPNPGPGVPMPYAVVFLFYFLLFSDFEVRGGCSFC